MKKYILKRFLQLIPVLIGITFLSFAMMRIAGSDAITELYGDMGAVAQEIIDAKRAELGLDQPFLTQYLAWVGGILTGDMGISYISGRDVFQTFVSKLPATLLLTVLAICATVIISIPLGVLAAVRHDKFTDYFLRFFSFIGNSLPNFFVALLLMQVFSIHWSIFPVISNGTTVQSAVLPTLTLAVAMSAKYMRQVRATVLEELNKGLAEREIKFGWDDGVLRLAATEAYGHKSGARDLRNVLRRRVEDPICTLLAGCPEQPPALIHAEEKDGEIVLVTA